MSDPTAPWSTMKSLTDKFSWTEHFNFIESFANSIVTSGFIDGSLGSWQFVQWGDLMFLTISFVAAAYVVCAAIEASVHFANSGTDKWGFYADYANWSSMGTLIYLWESLLVVAWNWWAFLYLILAVIFAADVWGQLERRHIENQ